MSVLVFDIETVPDVAGLRRVWSLPDSLSDAEVAQAAFDRRRPGWRPLGRRRAAAQHGREKGGGTKFAREDSARMLNVMQ